VDAKFETRAVNYARREYASTFKRTSAAEVVRGNQQTQIL